jgi:hypothetical protein
MPIDHRDDNECSTHFHIIEKLIVHTDDLHRIAADTRDDRCRRLAESRRGIARPLVAEETLRRRRLTKRR